MLAKHGLVAGTILKRHLRSLADVWADSRFPVMR